MSKKKQSSQNESDIKLIRKANEFVEARYKFDIWETRVFAYMLTLIHYSDTDFAEYKINVGDIISEFNLSRAGSVYEEIKKASEKLLSKKVQIERISPSGAVEILDTYLVVSTSRPKKEQKDNYIKLSFHPSLKPFLIELKERYLVYDIRNILSLTSIYSIRLYELLKQYQKIGSRHFSVVEIKSLLSIDPNEYVLYGHFKQRVLKKAQKDLLEHTDIYFTFEEETEKKKVFAITFRIFENKKNQRVNLSQGDSEGDVEHDSIDANQLDAIAKIYNKVSDYVSKAVVSKWVKEVSIEHIENAIAYTFNHIESGKKVENIGGFLNKMVYTPNLFNKYKEKKENVTPRVKKREDVKNQVEGKLEILQQLREDFEETMSRLEVEILENDGNIANLLVTQVKANQFYDNRKTFEENMERDSIKGLKGALLQELSPVYAQTFEEFAKKISDIKDELKSLGHRE